MGFIFGIRPAQRSAIKRSCNLASNGFLLGMFFPLSRSLKGIVSRGFVSIPGQGANKAFLAGLAPSTSPFLVTSYKCQKTPKMSRDVSGQSNINKMNVEPDGSFKRAPSSFRNSIQKGGQFPPEKGTAVKTLLCPDPQPVIYHRSLPSLRVIRLP